MRIAIVVLAISAGCQPGVDYCLGPYRSENGPELDRKAIGHNEEMIMEMFTASWPDQAGKIHQPLFKNRGDICSAFGGIPIGYRDVDKFSCGSVSGGCIGVTEIDGIHLTRSGEALAHELLHVYEVEHIILDSGLHPNWWDKGYWWLANYYFTSMNEPVIHGQ